MAARENFEEHFPGDFAESQFKEYAREEIVTRAMEGMTFGSAEEPSVATVAGAVPPTVVLYPLLIQIMLHKHLKAVLDLYDIATHNAGRYPEHPQLLNWAHSEELGKYLQKCIVKVHTRTNPHTSIHAHTITPNFRPSHLCPAPLI